MLTFEASARHTSVATVAALLGLAGALNAGAALEAENLDNLVRRVVAQTTRSGVAVRATRHLEAGTASGRHRGWMEVETSVAPGGAFRWSVLHEGGSERTRDKVFRAILDAEGNAWRSGEHEAAAISPANYQFITAGPAADGYTRIHLKPRRADSRLVSGTLTVSADGSPLVLEGRLAKSPSFWVKSVTVMKRYARVGGIALPVVIESLADVKMLGKSSFSMRYRYLEVNGRSVAHHAAASTRFGPSPQLLVLHAALEDGQ